MSRNRVQVVLRDRMIDLARLQCGEALLRVSGTYLTLPASPKRAAAKRLADVDIEAGIAALVIRLREPGEAGVDAADDLAGLLDLVQGRPGLCRRR